MSLKLGRGESVESLLCLRIAEKRRKRKIPVARGAGPASKVFIRHPRERSHSRSRPDRVGGLGNTIVLLDSVQWQTIRSQPWKNRDEVGELETEDLRKT